MAFPITSLLDNFNRANENPIATGWSGPWRHENTNQQQLSGNGLWYTSSGLTNSSYWDLDTFGPDCEAWIDVSSLAASQFPGVGVRITSPGASWAGYSLTVEGPNSVSTWRISSRDGTTLTNIATQGSVDFTSGQAIGLEAIGTTITAYKKIGGVWTNVVSVVDSTAAGAGYIGASHSNYTNALDNFGGGTVVGGGGIVLTQLERGIRGMGRGLLIGGH